jgi:hypothetical protein
MDDKKRIHIETLNFEIKPYQWYQWIVKRHPPLYHYTWGLFTRDLEEQYGEVWEQDYFSQLTRQLGDIEEYNLEFLVLATRVDNLSEEHLLEAYMGGLKEYIKHEIFLIKPMSITEAMQNAHHIHAKNKATHKYSVGGRHRFGGHKTTISQPTRLTPQQMDERREKGLCFNCDSKYSKGHKCGEKKLFYIDCEEEEDSVPKPTRFTPQQMDERREKGLCFNYDSKYSKGYKCGENKLFYIDCEEEEDQELEPSQDPNLEETTPTISCHALAGIVVPQSLKIQGYIKKKKVTILIDSGSTHNFIDYKLAKDLNCCVYPAPDFQVMIADGGTINCSGKCHSIKINMGEYFLDIPMIAIQMGGVYVVLGY